MIWWGEYPVGDAIVDGSDRSGLPLCARDTKQRMAAIVLMMMMIVMTMMTLVMMMIIMFTGHYAKVSAIMIRLILKMITMMIMFQCIGNILGIILMTIYSRTMMYLFQCIKRSLL